MDALKTLDRATVIRDVKRLETSASARNIVKDVALAVPALAAVVAAGVASSEIFLAAAIASAAGIGLSKLIYRLQEKKVRSEIDDLAKAGGISSGDREKFAKELIRLEGTQRVPTHGPS
jgi:hypothetical protein